MALNYILLEDGSGHILLEDSSGSILLENQGGIATLVFGGTPVLKGKGTLKGTEILTFAGTSNLKGLGKLLGTEALTFTSSGHGVAFAYGRGIAALTFGSNTTLKGLGTLKGGTSLSFSCSADPLDYITSPYFVNTTTNPNAIYVSESTPGSFLYYTSTFVNPVPPYTNEQDDD